MDMKLLNPSKLILPSDGDDVKRFLTFTDRSVKYQIKRLKDNFWFKNSDPEGFERRVNELKEQEKRCLLSYDAETGLPVTYSGLWHDLEQRFGWNKDFSLDIPEGQNIPWANVPKFPPRYYQSEAVEALIAARHGAVELPTGSGKTRVIFELVKRLGLPTVIQTPSATITTQIYEEMVYLFGKKWVGKYGDGKKELGKLFTVATGQSLAKVEKGSDAWEHFQKVVVYTSDESHTNPAETFEGVSSGLLKNASYRFYVSATQLRNDGSEMILKGITGPIVYRKDFKELVNEGFLARPFIKMMKVQSHGHTGMMDINKETKNQLYLNPKVNKMAADIALKCVSLANRQTVILIDEFEQFLQLRNFITIPFEFVHGGATNRKNKKGESLRDTLPKEYWESDTEAAIERFNKGETRLLIGTSAISTGVDLRPTGAIIYLQGGTSETKIKQAAGRGTRVTEDKKDVFIFDFKIMGSKSMEKHADVRSGIYSDLGDVEELG